MINIKKEIARLEATSDSLIAVSQDKDDFTMQYVRSFNAIQTNLDSIKAMEKLISEQSASNEVSKSLETDINRDIDAIYQLLLKNKQHVDRLKSQLSSSGRQSKELEQMISNLSAQISDKDAEITQLKVDLSQKKPPHNRPGSQPGRNGSIECATRSRNRSKNRRAEYCILCRWHKRCTY